MALWTCRCAWTTPNALPTCPQQQQQQQKNQPLEPRFKIDRAASPMPETSRPERLAPRATSNRNGGRDHLGTPGEIKSVHPGEIIGIRTNFQTGREKRDCSRLITILKSCIPAVAFFVLYEGKNSWFGPHIAIARATARAMKNRDSRAESVGSPVHPLLAIGSSWATVWRQNTKNWRIKTSRNVLCAVTGEQRNRA